MAGAEAAMMGSKIWLWLFIAVLPGSLAGAAPGPFSGFGNTLDNAKKTDFFQFFHLEQTGESSVKDGKTIVFQPSGEKFHDLVRVYMTVDSKGLIQGASLELSRSFVDSPQDGIYARDIAKSFLSGAIEPQDLDRVNNLIIEIGQPIGTDRPVIAHPDSVHKPDGPPSMGYRVYLGKENLLELPLPHGQTLRMENPASKPPVLKISLR
jgi:hypothetical protein